MSIDYPIPPTEPPEASADAEAHVQSLTDQIKHVPELAPLSGLLLDDSVADILINGTQNVYIEQKGRLKESDIRFSNIEEVNTMAHAIAKAVNRSINPERPMLDARLNDGSRVNIIMPPLAVDGCMISIRKFARADITLDAMMKSKSLSRQLGEFLKVCGRCRLNILISGGTGSGKTTLLNAISQYIEPGERIVTIEDAAELRLQQPHVVRLETKPQNETSREDVTARDLVKNALRMRPDRIIIGEVRGAESFDMMQAMNSGHEGSLTTIHANHPRDALGRLESMIAMMSLNIPSNVIRSQIAGALHLVVQVSRMRDGQRRITYVSEITGMEGNVVCMQDLFHFQVTGEDEFGRMSGEYKWLGIMPRFIRRVSYWGQRERLAAALGINANQI